MANRVFALLHSPLVGPASWAGVAVELAHAGVRVIVPDVREAAESGAGPDAVVDSAAAQLPNAELVLVGHSGAGRLLPAIAVASRNRAAGFVFVDAHLPPESRSAPLADEEFLATLTGLAEDGILPPWSEWWGPTAMERLVPDPVARAAVSNDMPRVLLDYFRSSIPAVPGWAERPCGYVRLSELYEPSAADAEERGWPVVRFTAGHLHAVVDPAGVASAILDVAPADLGG